jgi:hypothetical protein
MNEADVKFKDYDFDFRFDESAFKRHNFERKLDYFGTVMSKELRVRKDEDGEVLVYHYKVKVREGYDDAWFNAIMFYE